MKVYIFSTQREIGQLITDQLSLKDHLCYPFHTFELLKDFVTKNTLKPDLLILDYLSFNHDIFNIYRYFDRYKHHVPVVFYNDPCLLRPSRCEHWLLLIQRLQNFYLKFDLEKYRPILQDLEDLVESPSVKPYIYLFAKPKPLPPMLIKDPYTLEFVNTHNDSLSYFQKEIHLRPSLFYLLSLLYKHQTSEISQEEILELYQEDGKQMTIQSLKVLISQLRQIIRKNHQCGFFIYSHDKKYKIVYYK